MNYENMLPTDFQSLDGLLGGGFHGGSLHVIAARPGMGKTLFALQCTAGMAKNPGKKMCIFSPGMGRDHIKQIFAELCNRDNLLLDDTAAITISQIRTRLAGITVLGAVAIDDLGLIHPEDGADPQNASSANEIARELKRIAREFDIPVVCTSRLPRSTDNRRDGRPILTDLEEISGGLIQDADVILFPYRHAYFDPVEADPGSEIIVAKNRYGGCGSLPFHFDCRIPQFSEEL